MAITFEQLTSDFWKEKMILLQRQNSRTNCALSNLEQAKKEIIKLQTDFPSLKMENDFSSGYVSSEIFLDSEFHIRLFIQTQTKISFLIKSRNVFEKIADAKLFNSPFSSVIHFINHFEEYKVQIYREKQALQEYQMKQKLAGEFIKSVLITRIGKTGWTLNYCPKDFELCINQDGKIEKYPLSIDSFIPELENISVLFHSLP